MVAAVAAAAVVAKNVRLFIVTSLAVLMNLVNAIRTPNALSASYSNSGTVAGMSGTVAPTKLAEEPRPLATLPTIPSLPLLTVTCPCASFAHPRSVPPFNLSCESPSRVH